MHRVHNPVIITFLLVHIAPMHLERLIENILTMEPSGKPKGDILSC